MELRSLRCFLTVAEEGNITRAAESMHLTQPTLSRMLMQLEEDVGSQLIIRGKRNIQLTEAGMILRRRAEEILDLVEKTEKEVVGSDQKLEGKLSIGVFDCEAIKTFLPQVIRAFSAKYPDVTFEFFTGNSDLIKELLNQGNLDVGLLLEPIDINRYDFVRLPIKEIWGILVNTESSLNSKENFAPEDLRDCSTFLFGPQRPLVQKEIESWAKCFQNHLNYKATYQMLSSVINYVENGFGSIITIKGAYHYKSEKVRFIPFKPELKTGTSVVWKKNGTSSKILSKFLNEVYLVLDAFHE